MRVPLSWINDYVDIEDISPRDYAAALTMSGSMVERIECRGDNIINVVTGRILKIKRHPDADKLVVCEVDVGGETVQIVTGATNMKEGDCVAVAKDGATLPDKKIKKGMLRGVESFGMMCSEDELGLTKERAEGIMILPPDTPLGVDIRDYLELNENIAEFEITSNRPDCLSVIGLARETAVTFGRGFSVKTPKVTESGGDIKDFISVEVLDPDLCPRYCCRVVKNVRIAPSPAWMKKRLEDSGVRSINNIVDITNYVMLEYGQPMHAFDLKTLEGGKIIVRRAAEGERMTTLDGEKRELDTDTLVIADGRRPVALAGIMGGENSEIQDTTATILFESANFNGISVRASAKKAGLRTESSARFEKGLDINLAPAALDRACELVCELGAGEIVSGVIDVCAPIPQKKEIAFDPDYINKFLGTDIDREFMENALTALEFEVREKSVVVPSFRADIEGGADLAEEIARLYGYNKIPSTLYIGAATLGGKSEKQRAEDLIRDTLTSLGFYEIITYSFVSPKIYDKLNLPKDDYIEIANPLGEEQSIMRTTAIGSALEALAVNYNHRNENVSLFELATTYKKGGEKGLAIEKQEIVIAMYGDDTDYYSIKGAVEQLFESFGINNYDIEPESNNPVFHPGQTAVISLRRKRAAVLGRIHPSVLKNFEINKQAYVAVIDFDLLLECKKLEKKYKPLPKYPAVTRDLALVVPDDVNVRSIEDIVKKVKSDITESFSLFDVYKGKQVEEGFKSVAYSLTFRALDRTLTDDEVNSVMDKILSELKQKLNAKLRL
ncbi:MAG: Phenylalanine--tRNA ligase beta subunit [Firmicutes bacterium ADurb.Bin193]|nr:MAG: Phenylalanine--tRNA ligase beta subunit [Firmicutes bacterium ADurb.Bin193]